jgi:ATP-dependent Lon protease
VLPIGGLKEKILAAHRAKIGHIILPKDNEKDLVDIPDNVRKELSFHPVSMVDEVLDIVFDKPLKPKKKKVAAKKGKKLPKTASKRASATTLN